MLARGQDICTSVHLVGGSCCSHLRRHVEGCATPAAGDVTAVDAQLAEAKVDETHVILTGQQHVLDLEIPAHRQQTASGHQATP